MIIIFDPWIVSRKTAPRMLHALLTGGNTINWMEMSVVKSIRCVYFYLDHALRKTKLNICYAIVINIADCPITMTS